MKVEVIFTKEKNGKWGWKIHAKGVEAGGKGVCETELEARKQAMDFIKEALIPSEMVSLHTDTIVERIVEL